MEKTYKSTQKFLIESPRKLRLVAALIRKMTPLEAIEKLPFAGKKAAGDLAKVIKSALANARNQSVSDTELIFKEIQIGEGPRLKRGRAASRGRYHPYKKRMSHIRVILTTRNNQIPNDKLQVNSNKKRLETKAETSVVKKGGKAGRGTVGSSSEK